jgi:hypothetical protein
MAGSLQDALDAYSLGLSWREAFSVAKELQYSDSAIADLGYGLIGGYQMTFENLPLLKKHAF